MEKYDLVIILGSQIKKGEHQYFLAPHTELKAWAAGIAWQKQITNKFIVSGGYNFRVRYDESRIFPEPDLSFDAFVRGRKEKSEAEIIRDFLKENFNIPEEAIFLEEVSANTEENAAIVKILLKRPTFSFAKKIGILTTRSHMKRALQAFKEVGLEVEPLFAEDLLALEGKSGIDKVFQYY